MTCYQCKHKRLIAHHNKTVHWTEWKCELGFEFGKKCKRFEDYLK